MEHKYETTLKYGLIFSIPFFFASILPSFFDIEYLSNINITSRLIILVIGILISLNILKRYKGDNNVSTNFKGIFSLIFLFWITGVFISYIFDYVYFNFIVPEYAMELKQYSIEQIEMTLENVESNSFLEGKLEELEEANLYSFKNVSLGFLYNIPAVAILTAIISYFINKLIILKVKKS